MFMIIWSVIVLFCVWTKGPTHGPVHRCSSFKHLSPLRCLKWEHLNEWWCSGLAFCRGKLPLKIVCGFISQSFCHPQVLERFTARLTQLRLLSHRDLRTLTKYQLILARQQFRSNPHTHIQVGPVWQSDCTLQWATSLLASFQGVNAHFSYSDEKISLGNTSKFTSLYIEYKYEFAWGRCIDLASCNIMQLKLIKTV